MFMYYRGYLHHGVSQLPTDNSALKGALLGALIGAVATFVFLLFHDFIKSIKEKRSTHLNSLVKLQVELLLDGETINENLYAIPDFIESLKKNMPYLQVLGTFDINLDHLQELHNVDLNNNILTYQIHTRKLNKDISATQRNYDELKAGLLSGDDKRQKMFVDNAPQFIAWLQQLASALKVHLTELDALEAEVRLHLKKDPSWLRKQKMKFLKNPELTEDEIKAEIEIVSKERDQSEEEDKERISKMKEHDAK
jgi:hypothetical protein